MGLEVVYEIARYAVDTDAEVLVERAQVLAENGALRQRDLDGAETPCDEKDVSAVIAAYPSLNEIRANQVTRIEAQPSAFELLPFLLRAPGSADDLDESLWSNAMRQEHLESSKGDERGAYRVAYINGLRWGAYDTNEGRMDVPRGQLQPGLAAATAVESVLGRTHFLRDGRHDLW